MAGLLDFLQSASNSAASNVSAPVDGIAWALRKLGAPMPDKPFMGSDWMAEKGLTRPVEQSVSSLAGETASLLAPFGVAAKAPQIAKGLLQMGENAMVPQALSKQAGVFIGPGAKTWNADAAARANTMTDAGTDARKVWSDTGTWKAPDGMWRQEIADNAMQIESLSTLNAKDKAGIALQRSKLMDEVKAQGGRATDAQKFQMNNINNHNSSDAYRGTMGEALKHDELYAAYPSTANTKFNWMEMPAGTKGEYSPESGIALNMGIFGKDAESFAAHEMQHAIQSREGWAKGGSVAPAEDYAALVKRSNSAQDGYLRAKAAGGMDPDSGLSIATFQKNIDGLSDQISKWVDPYETYRRLAGEAEARATQARLPLDDAGRRAMFPADSYDVPLDQLIVRR